ncbi:hypothetical protein [Vibrio astriarenae]|uniref:hypothetical protein n=1 Tax=Vibrio astriarenae TaxID=1481923 RepID=UPI0037352947
MRVLELSIAASLITFFLAGCANQEPLGRHVANLSAEQTYNPNASIENLGHIPTGTGERMESAYQNYTGKSELGSEGALNSQFVEGFGSESN